MTAAPTSPAPPIWLLLDCGNSAVKWALASAASPDLIDSGYVLLEAHDWSEQLRAALHPYRHPHRDRHERIAAAFGCLVAAPSVAAAIDGVAGDLFGSSPLWRGAAARFQGGGTKLENGYREPERLGADRWHGLIAARLSAPLLPLLVVTAGTATTVDAVSAGGRFEGGAIAPGLDLMRDSLARGTARLPRASGRWVELPDNTDDAIESGVVDAQVGLVERRLRAFAAHCGAPVRLLLAGGHARLLARLLSRLLPDLPASVLSGPPSIEDNLVLRGVFWRARYEPDAGDR
jgi:type III pantothenate kinase